MFKEYVSLKQSNQSAHAHMHHARMNICTNKHMQTCFPRALGMTFQAHMQIHSQSSVALLPLSSPFPFKDLTRKVCSHVCIILSMSKAGEAVWDLGNYAMYAAGPWCCALQRPFSSFSPSLASYLHPLSC